MLVPPPPAMRCWALSHHNIRVCARRGRLGTHIAGVRSPKWHKTSQNCSADFCKERLAFVIYVYSALEGSYISADSFKVGAILGHGLVTELVKTKREIACRRVPERSLLLFATLV